MIDCRDYGEGELSLWVMNEEFHYLNLQRQIRTGCTFDGYVEIYIDPYFLYTEDQLSDLEDTFIGEGVQYEKDLKRMDQPL